MSAETPVPEVIGVQDGDKQLTQSGSDEQATYNDFSAIAERGRKYVWEGTVWDSSVLVGLPALGVPTSILIVLALLLNIAVRAVVASVILEKMTESQFDGSFVASLQAWRTSDAHSVVYSDSISGQSLATRLCHGDRSLSIAEGKANLIHTVQSYLDGSTGELTQIGLMVLLCAVAFPELINSLGCCVSLLVTPKGNTSLMKVGDQLFLQSVLCCRLASVLLLNIIRTLLTIATLWGTMKVIGLTVNFADMFVAFAGGAAIFWGYEALAKACVPASVYAVMRVMSPQPPNKGPPVWPFLATGSATIFFGYVLVIVIFFVADMQPQKDNMQQVLDTLCGGNLNFLFSFNPDMNGGNVYAMRSSLSTVTYPDVREQVMSLASSTSAWFNSEKVGKLWDALDGP